MTRYSFKSRKTGNRIEAEYAENGLLTALRIEGDIDQVATSFVLNNIPIHSSGASAWLPEHFETTLVPYEIKWDNFWEAYPKRVGKQAAMSKWQKLSQADRARAIRRLPQYLQWCQSQSPPRQVCDPERYLKDRRFDDEFKI